MHDFDAFADGRRSLTRRPRAASRSTVVVQSLDRAYLPAASVLTVEQATFENERGRFRFIRVSHEPPERTCPSCKRQGSLIVLGGRDQCKNCPYDAQATSVSEVPTPGYDAFKSLARTPYTGK